MITVVICTFNSKKTIMKCLDSLLMNNPDRVIIVDANSTDGTHFVLNAMKKEYEKMNISFDIYYDDGSGLANARNIGLEKTRTKYILYLGSDNYLIPGSLEELRVYINKHNWTGCGLLTRVGFPNNYIEKCNDKRWEMRFFEGERNNIGTPFMFRTSILKAYKFDSSLKFADDTDLCYRLKRDGYKLGYSNIKCYELGIDTWKDIKTRFLMYGKCDKWHAKKHGDNWLILHPLKAELCLFFKIKGLKKFYYLPFLLYITFMRYLGRLKG